MFRKILIFPEKNTFNNFRIYQNIASSLCQICSNKELHWRHIDFAQALLSLLLRRDTNLQSNIVLHFFQLLISDSIKTRKLAVAFCSSWFKINRQKAKKIVKNIQMAKNAGPGAKWPIQFGIRNDNE